MSLPRLLLDTDVLSAAMRHDPRALPHAGAYLREHEHLTFSIVTRFEILRGLKARRATTQLKTFRELCDKSEVLPVTNEVVDVASDVYAYLHQEGTLITDADILIGATALASQLPLVTNNTSHFSRIRGLRLFNWLDLPA